MRTNIEIDDGLMQEAMEAAGTTTKKATVRGWVADADRDGVAGRHAAASGPGEVGRESGCVAAGTKYGVARAGCV